MSIYDAAMRYGEEGVPLLVLGGKEYGSGSSRDWAAKGTRLLGVRVVIAESFERIHRSNLIGMGVLPLQFPDGMSAASLALSGHEVFSVTGLAPAMAGGGAPPRVAHVRAEPAGGGSAIEFDARVRIDTPREAEYYRHGGILPYVLRQLLAS
jgi:aconitate hydratase